jgi:hypothetical protein
MQTPEAKNIVMFQKSLESKVQVPVDKSVDNIAAVPGQVEKAAEEQSTVQEIHEKIEGKAADEALPGESQTVVEVSGDETYNIEQTVLRRGPSAVDEGIRLINFPRHRFRSSANKGCQMFLAHGIQ